MHETHLRWPPEWTPHKVCWLAYPCDASLWEADLQGAQEEFVDFCRVLMRHEPLCILVPDQDAARELGLVLGHERVQFFVSTYGDIWLRDTGPLFLQGSQGMHAACFAFNGWGHKYLFSGDIGLSGRIAALAQVPAIDFSLVLEGGSVECDGTGLVLTSRQCLLNPNRNPGLSQEGVEEGLAVLGAARVLWVTEGLQNDHTDGHIDTIARFVAPGVVACMMPSDDHDPNAAALRRIRAELAELTDVAGRPLKIIEIVSPGAIYSGTGTLLPASYLNFYIGNGVVIVPTYGSPHDTLAVKQLGEVFVSRHCVGSNAKSILSGGGAFHCMSQQEPQFVGPPPNG